MRSFIILSTVVALVYSQTDFGAQAATGASQAVDTIVAAPGQVIGGVLNPVESAVNTIADAPGKILGGVVQGLVGGILSPIPGVVQTFVNPATGLIVAVRGVIPSTGSISGWLPSLGEFRLCSSSSSFRGRSSD